MNEPTNLEEIVAAWLRTHSYDGLYNDDGECACIPGNDFMPCDAPRPHCEPGMFAPCTCGEGCDFHIGPRKPEARKGGE